MIKKHIPNEPSKQQRDPLWLFEKLTPSEIEQLRQEKKEDNDYFQKAFEHLKRK
jgi:hypothetical protein